MALISTLIIALAYSFSCLCTGSVLVGLCPSKSLRNSPGFLPAGGIASIFFLGQAFLASIWTMLGLAGWFNLRLLALIVFGLCLGGACFAYPHLARLIHLVCAVARDVNGRSWGWRCLAFLTLLVAFAGVTSIGRPLEGDGVAFYLPLAKVLAASHHLSPLPAYEDFTSIGLSGELHFAALMALGTTQSALILPWITLLFSSLVLASICSQTGSGRSGQWIGTCILFTSTSVLFLLGDGKVDLFAFGLGLAAYYWALEFNTHRQQYALCLTGLLCGAAIVAKISYLVVMLPSILTLILWPFGVEFFEKCSLKSKVHGSIIWSCFASAFVLAFWITISLTPHFLKNLVLFGNPFFPFVGNSAGWADQIWYSSVTTRRILLTYPLALSFGQYWAQYGNVSPLILGLMPLSLYMPRPQRWLSSPLAALTVAATLGMLAWISVRPSVLSPRYYLATLLLFIPLTSKAAEIVSTPKTGRRWVGGLVIPFSLVLLISVGLASLNVIFHPVGTFNYFMGRNDEGRGMSKYYAAHMFLNETAEQGSRILLYCAYRFWLRPDLIQCSSNQTEPKLINQATTTIAKWGVIARNGFDYLLIDHTSYGQAADNLELDNPPNGVKLTKIFDNKIITVYHIDVEGVIVKREVCCRPEQPSNWKPSHM